VVAEVFISYSTKDGNAARTICGALESRGLSCWIASRDIPPGGNFMEAIVRAISAAKVMVLVFSQNANNSDEIEKEIVLAGNANVAVIPVRLENVVPKGAFAYQMATRQWIDLFEDWENRIDQLAFWIKKIIPVGTAADAAAPPADAAVGAQHAGADMAVLDPSGHRGQTAKAKWPDEEKRGQTEGARLTWTPSRRAVLLGGGFVGACAVAGVAALTHYRKASNSGFLIRTLTGHFGGVESVAIAPDGFTALSGSQDQTLRLWDLKTGSTLRTFVGHTDGVASIAITSDGRRALSGSYDKTLRLWDLASGTTLLTFTGHTDRVNSVAFGRDGLTALSASDDKTLKLWDLANGGTIRTFIGHTDEVKSVAIAPDGRTALSGSIDETLRLWNLATASVIDTFGGHTNYVYSVAIAHEGRTALSGSRDKTVRVWELPNGKMTGEFLGHTNTVLAVASTPGGRSAVSGGLDNKVMFWDTATCSTLRTFTGHTNEIMAVTVAPDGRTALSGSWDKTLKLWDLT
jgi:WD40 repeat protein